MRDVGGQVTLRMMAALFLLVTAALWESLPTLAVAAGESDFVGLTPCRLVDTRGNGFSGAFGPPALAAGVPRDFPLQGQCGIPTTATAVSLNVTATNTLGPGFLTLYPQGGAQPLVSTLNYVAGETVANAAIVPLGASGVSVVAGVSGTDLILDVNGYTTDSLVHATSLGSLFVGLGPGTLGTGGGIGNTAVGSGALFSNSNGGGNTAVGNAALASNTTGFGNIAIGQNAGFAPTNGLSNIHIGSNGQSADTQTIRIGTPLSQTQTFIAGIHGVTAPGPDVQQVTIDSNGQLGSFVFISTRRAKTDIEDMGERSRGLLALRPVTFHYRARPDGPLQYGLIAEEVAEVYPDLVRNDAGGEPESVRYEMLPPMLLSELQRQERVLADKERQLQAQSARLTELATTVAELAAEVARLKERSGVAIEHPGQQP
jgi:endosialidase-like protein